MVEEFNRAYREAVRKQNRKVQEIIEKGPQYIIEEFERLDEPVHGPYLVSRDAEVELSLMEEAAWHAIDEAQTADDIGPFLSCKLKRARDATFKKLEDINQPE